jgi:hypothetical protein
MVQLVWLIYHRVDLGTLKKHSVSKRDGEERSLLDRSVTKSDARKLDRHLISKGLVLSGLALAAAMLCAGIVASDFGRWVSLGNTVIAIVMSLLLSTASVRVLAMGDRHPVGGIGV